MSEEGHAAGKSRGTASSKQTSRGKESHRVSVRPSLTEYQSQRLRTREMDKISGGRETQTEPAEAEAEGGRGRGMESKKEKERQRHRDNIRPRGREMI